MGSKDNANKWFDYSKKHAPEAVSKFVMLWIAFNWEYSEYSDGGFLPEPTTIRHFCRDRDNRKKLLGYDPFVPNKTEAIKVFKKGPVFDDRYDRYKNSEDSRVREKYEKALEKAEAIYEGLKSNEPAVRMENLILTIYQVRCNLFHGSKTPLGPRETRDSELIESSAEIMEEYMKRLLGRDEWS